MILMLTAENMEGSGQVKLMGKASAKGGRKLEVYGK